MLDVDAALLAERGAVDAQVAAQMAAGCTAALAPTGASRRPEWRAPEPQDGKQPVGNSLVAVDGPSGLPDSDGAGGGKVAALRLNGGRAEIRRESRLERTRAASGAAS
ncbi:hypothetical protein ACRAWF_17950 [Streptomyces sp. L7]